MGFDIRSLTDSKIGSKIDSITLVVNDKNETKKIFIESDARATLKHVLLTCFDRNGSKNLEAGEQKKFYEVARQYLIAKDGKPTLTKVKLQKLFAAVKNKFFAKKASGKQNLLKAAAIYSGLGAYGPLPKAEHLDLKNGVIIFTNVTEKNIKTMILKDPEFRPGLVNSSKVIVTNYVHNGKAYVALVPTTMWQDKDYHAGMDRWVGYELSHGPEAEAKEGEQKHKKGGSVAALIPQAAPKKPAPKKAPQKKFDKSTKANHAGTVAAGVQKTLSQIELAAVIQSLIAQLGTKSTQEARDQAAKGLLKIGVNALPYLTDALLNSKDADVVMGATFVLYKMGVKAKPAVPALINKLRTADEDLTNEITDALIEIGPGALESCVARLGDENKNVAKAMKEVIIEIDASEADYDTALALVKALKHKNVAVRIAAMDILAEIIKKAKADEDEEMLGIIIDSGKQLFTDSLRHGNVNLRVATAKAMAEIAGAGFMDELPLTAILVALKDESPEVRRRMAYIIGEGYETSSMVVSALVAQLGDSNDIVRVGVTKALMKLHKIGAKPVSADTPALRSALGDKKPEVRKTAAYLLGIIRPSEETTVNALVWLIKGINPRIAGDETPEGPVITDEDKDTAMNSLVRIGKPAVGYVLPEVKSNDYETRWRAAYILGKIGYANNDVITGLVTLLKDVYPSVREAAAQALGRLGSKAGNWAASELVFKLEDASADVRAKAKEALVWLSETAVTPLIARIKEAGIASNLRKTIAGILVKIGKPAVAYLKELLNHSNQEVRNLAQESLNKIKS